MKKIIHLSDLHIGYPGLGTTLGNMVNRMILTKIPAENYVVVITGDLVDDATRPGSYEEVDVHITRLKAAGFFILLVTGNHDVGTGVLGSAHYMKKFNEYFFKDTKITYPKLDIIEEIAFVGLNSMAEEVHWHDATMAQGELGKKQLGRLSLILQSDQIQKSKYKVVYLHHHPLHPLHFNQLKDSEELKKTLNGHSIDALLFGHNHEGLIWNGSDGWAIKRIYDSGTSTGKNGKPNPHRVIDLTKEPASDYDAHF